MVDGKEIHMAVSIGDRVVVNKYSGSEVKLDDVEYVIIKISDVLAIIE